MALLPNGLDLIRENLKTIAQGQKPKVVRIGTLRERWLLTINAQRAEDDLDPITDEILFDGRHLYQSRCFEDGYSIDEVLVILASALSETAEVVPGWSTVLRNRVHRLDSHGRTIHDEAVFECHARRPRPELLSVIPRGDGKNHSKKKKTTR